MNSLSDSSQGPLGVLLVNLGTPDAPTPDAIRRYLGEFLHDRRVVDIPRVIWCPILHFIILRVRPGKLVHNYQQIWGEDGAPIRVHTAALADMTEARLRALQPRREILVRPAMTYGNPAIFDVITAMKADGVNEFMVLPLFPQYAGATTAAVYDKLAKGMKKLQAVPAVRFVDSYYQHPAYIEALAKTVRPHVSALGDDARLLFSFHGVPKAHEDRGDPYPRQCEQTAERVARALGLTDASWMVCYQSRFGAAEWLQPYTSEVLKSLPGEGVKRVFIICPGFATDCLETLEEIEVENRGYFLEAGGADFTYIPALNASDSHADLMTAVITDKLFADERPMNVDSVVPSVVSAE